MHLVSNPNPKYNLNLYPKYNLMNINSDSFGSFTSILDIIIVIYYTIFYYEYL